jgi:signal transduction histidine kinase
MSAHRLRWLIFLSCGALLAVALAWVTFAALDLERKGFAERAENLEQELQNMALSRMDAYITTLLARENERSSQLYLSFYEPESAFTLGSQHAVDPEGYYYASPLLRKAPDTEFVHVYFMLMPDGTLSSPQLPQDEFRTLALGQGFVTRESLERVEGYLERLEARLSLPSLVSAIGRLRRIDDESPRRTPLPELGDEGEPLDLLALIKDPAERARRAHAELRFRNSLVSYASGGQIETFVPHILAGTAEEPFALLFLRQVKVGDQNAVQGIWIDWEKLESFLLRAVRDLYPSASLVPTRSGTEGAVLVTIPFAFDPGPAREFSLSGLTPTRLALLGLWIALLAAAVAVGLMLQKTLELSERRRSFVSAVTHELRTPLTTFCMYSEMLAEGMVSDPAAQQEYFATLKDESVRLRRIVENVLGYARLEGRRNERPLERLAAEDLLHRVLPALERRAAEAGMELVPESSVRQGARVAVDVQAVEQILFNLVDNACKYAARGEPEIRLETETTRDTLIFRVLDRGPGIPDGVEKAIFAPFRRAAGDDAAITPGLGLGLSLARGMARGLGGDVVLTERAGFGAVFELRLPLSTRKS